MTPDKDVAKLTSVDESGGHLRIIPAEVRGVFRKYRTWVYWVLLVIFLVIPWLEFNQRQLILLNIPDREFTFFGLFFKAHDAPLIFLILIILTLGLAVVTAVWGRVWCGWACPQTVFIDAVYRRIEIWVEGNYIERRRLAAAPLSFSKASKFVTKWALYFAVSSLIAHSFVAYFTGSRELLQMMQGPPAENWSYFLLILFFTALITFNFAWFREQFCVIMCPYGRIQSVLLEPSSLAVVYDSARGEPRKSRVEKGAPSGDCVSCNRCVEVCPTGIDIRNGLQMECISCTACIDACNDVMTKMKRPLNLIGYKTLDGSPVSLFKFKTIAYGLAILVASLVLAYNVASREPVDIAVLRALESPYSEVIGANGEPEIVNHFRMHFTSQSDDNLEYSLQLSEDAKSMGLSMTSAVNQLKLKAKASDTWHFFVRSPRSRLPKAGKLAFTVEVTGSENQVYSRTLTFIGPTQ